VSQQRSEDEIAELPAWGLYAANGHLVATTRALDALEAGNLFRDAGYRGKEVRWIPERSDDPPIVDFTL
jgi:hypothetical protein